MTKLEEQDAMYKNQGFNPDEENDYEYPEISKEEWQELWKIPEAIKNSEVKGELEKSLERAYCIIEVERIYQRNQKGLRVLSGKFNLNLEGIFNKLDIRSKLDEAVNFIVIDGGETRVDKSYESDGNTVKPGWVRFYWK